MKKKCQVFLLLLIYVVTSVFPVAAADPIPVYIDNTPPTIAVSGYSYNENILVVKGTAYDSYSGVESVDVSVNGGEFKPVDSFTPGEGGDWEFRYDVSNVSQEFGNFNFRAVDAAGNEAMISRTDIPLESSLPRLIYPNSFKTNTNVNPEIVGEPVKATAVLYGKGYEQDLGELAGPAFVLRWNGNIDGKPAPDGTYSVTVTTYSKTGRTTKSTTQASIGTKDIYGTVDSVNGNEIVVDGEKYIITPESQIDKNIEPGDTVSGTARENEIGDNDIVELHVTKKGREPISGVVESIGGGQIKISGQVYEITPSSKIDPNIKVGDTVKGWSIGNGNGGKDVETLELVKSGRERITGVVDSITDDKIVIDGKEYDITPNSKIPAGLEPGDTVTGFVIGNDDGGKDVEELQIVNKGRHPITGVVDSITDDKIVIDGKEYDISPNSKIDPDIKPGDTVKGFSIGEDGKVVIDTLEKVSDSGLGDTVLIKGIVGEIDDKHVVVDDKDYEITEASVIDPNIKPSDYVVGTGAENGRGGIDVISLIRLIDGNKIPTITDGKDEKIGEIEFEGVIEAKGDGYIVVDGKVIYYNDDTVFNCTTGTCSIDSLKVGDFVTGKADVYSKSGIIATEINKPFDDNRKSYSVVGRVTDMGDGWVEIERNGIKYIVTDDTKIPEAYKIGDIVRIDVFEHDDICEALAVVVLKYAECDPEKMAYHYGHLDGIISDSKEFVVDDLIYVPAANMIVDDHIADYEADAYVAFVNTIQNEKCEVIVNRVVQNAGAPREADLVIGEITDIKSADVNKNVPVYIANKYYFRTENTNVSEELYTGQMVAAVKVGEELISVFGINDLTLNTSDFNNIVGMIEKVSDPDNKDNRYIRVNGVDYRAIKTSVINETKGTLEPGAEVAVTVHGRDIVHLAVLTAKHQKTDMGNIIIGELAGFAADDNGNIMASIDGNVMPLDKEVVIYPEMMKNSEYLADHSKVIAMVKDGKILAVREHPAMITPDQYKVFSGTITAMSDESAVVDGTTYVIPAYAKLGGNPQVGMKAYGVYDTGKNAILNMFAMQNLPASIDEKPLIGDINAAGNVDSNGNVSMLIDGYQYTGNLMTLALESELQVKRIVGVTYGNILLGGSTLINSGTFGEMNTFDGFITRISDQNVDGSYVLTLDDGSELVLNDRTLVYDKVRSIGLEKEIAGVKFGNVAYLLTTSTVPEPKVDDVTFAGLLEMSQSDDSGVDTFTVNGKQYNVAPHVYDVETIEKGSMLVGALSADGSVLSMTKVNTQISKDDLTPVLGFIETLTSTNSEGERAMILDEAKYTLKGNSFESGNFVNGSRVSGIALVNDDLLALTVVESTDQGNEVNGQIESRSKDIVSPVYKDTGVYFVSGGFYNLVSDDTAKLSVDLKKDNSKDPFVENDKMYGYYYGQEREMLAVEELKDPTLFDKIAESTTAKIAIGTVAAVGGVGIIGGILSAILGKKKKKSAE